MRMTFILVEAVDGMLAKAQQATCEDCGCDTFHMFQIAGQQHPHYQCSKCGGSYCQEGECVIPKEAIVNPDERCVQCERRYRFCICADRIGT